MQRHGVMVCLAAGVAGLSVGVEWLTSRDAQTDPVMERVCNDTHCVIFPQRPNEFWNCGDAGFNRGPISCFREITSVQSAWRQWVSDRKPPGNFPRPPGVPIGWSVVKFSRG